MNKFVLTSVLATVLLSSGASIAEERQTDGSATAQRGGMSGYVVPRADYGTAGAQGGMNWTSKSGNTNLGGTVRADERGSSSAGASATFHW